MITKNLQSVIMEVEKISPTPAKVDEMYGDASAVRNMKKFIEIKKNCFHPILVVENYNIVVSQSESNPIFCHDATQFFCPVCRHYFDFDMLNFLEPFDRKCVYVCYFCLEPEEFDSRNPFAPYDQGPDKFTKTQMNIMRYAQTRCQSLIFKKATQLIMDANENLRLDELQIYLQDELQKYMENNLREDVINPTMLCLPVPKTYVEQHVIVKNPIKYTQEINMLFERKRFSLQKKLIQQESLINKK